MTWQLVTFAGLFLAMLYLTGYANGKGDCKEASAKRLQEVTVRAARESQASEDAIHHAPPSDDAPMSPVLNRAVDSVRP